MNITQKIFVTHRGHKETLSRWVKEVMKNADINMKIFKPHISRSASSSGAIIKAGVPIEETLKQGQWSNCRTFQKYYYWDTEDINMQYPEGVLPK